MKIKSTTFTCRIEQRVLQLLEKESEDQGISINTLFNKILRNYVEWDFYGPKVGMIPMARQVISSLFYMMGDEEISELATNFGKHMIKDITLFMKMKLDYDSFLMWLETRMKRSFIELNFQHENEVYTYVLKHDMGYNWSLYHKKLLEIIFYEFFEKPIKIEITNSILRFTFSK